MPNVCQCIDDVWEFWTTYLLHYLLFLSAVIWLSPFLTRLVCMDEEVYWLCICSCSWVGWKKRRGRKDKWKLFFLRKHRHKSKGSHLQNEKHNTRREISLSVFFCIKIKVSFSQMILYPFFVLIDNSDLSFHDTSFFAIGC